MRFLIDADLPRSTKAVLEKYGHEAIDARDVGLRKAKDPIVARYAQDHLACDRIVQMITPCGLTIFARVWGTSSIYGELSYNRSLKVTLPNGKYHLCSSSRAPGSGSG